MPCEYLSSGCPVLKTIKKAGKETQWFDDRDSALEMVQIAYCENSFSYENCPYYKGKKGMEKDIKDCMTTMREAAESLESLQK